MVAVGKNELLEGCRRCASNVTAWPQLLMEELIWEEGAAGGGYPLPG